MKLRIAVDAMGGDHAPASIVEGAIAASRALGHTVVLVGLEPRVRAEVDRVGAAGAAIEIVHAEEVVGMDEPAVTSLRRKKRSSIRVAARLVADGQADAFVSAGNTGAVMANLKVALGLLDGVDRPALAAVLPNRQGVSVWLDVGANVDTRPSHLVQFAIMGFLYSRAVIGVPQPRVGVLSIGEEEGKGNEATREVARRLRACGPGINFIGNVEGRDLFSGRADVIVCDGFIGNVTLKAIEAVSETTSIFLREEIERRWLARAGALLMRGAFRGFRRRVHYEEYGGVPLLGLRGAAIIGHGRSSPRAVQNAVRVAGEFVRQQVNDRIRDEMARLPAGVVEAGETSEAAL